jgi:hypothetical protein
MIIFPNVFHFLMEMYAKTDVRVKDVYPAAREIARLIQEYHGDLSILASVAGFNYQTLKSMEQKKKQLWLKIAGVMRQIG